MTPSQRLAEQLEKFGRCEVCGQLVGEKELISLTWRGSPEVLVCNRCYSDFVPTEVL